MDSSANPSQLPQWAPRVRPELIRRLYAGEAAGLLDSELLDEVFYAIRARCESIVIVTEASEGRVRCSVCGVMILRQGGGKDEVMQCAACGWKLTWGEYLKTYQGKQLHGGGALPAIYAYLEGGNEALSPQHKMLLVDALLHAYHWEAAQNPTRPVAVNMVYGTINSVVALLEELGFGSDPKMRESYLEWQENVRRVEQRWGPYQRNGSSKE
jgi:ribosomal protein S27E